MGKFKLKPHRVKRFKPTTDKDAEDKIRVIFHHYRSRPENSVVISFDQKSGIQAIDRSLPVIAMAPGCPEQRTRDYRRNGTTDLFAARDVHTGHIYARCYDRHRAEEVLDYMNWLEGELPRDIDVYIILDNLSAHKTRAVREWFAARPRWHTCFTPTSASWTNQIERWFAELARMVLKRGYSAPWRSLLMRSTGSLKTTTGIPGLTGGSKRRMRCLLPSSVSTIIRHLAICKEHKLHHTSRSSSQVSEPKYLTMILGGV